MATDQPGDAAPGQANPLTAPLDVQRRLFESMTDAVDTADVLPERMAEMGSVEVGQTPSDVVYEENKLELLHYDAEAAGIDVPEEDRESVPILIIYALINRPYILDLQPDRSVVRRLLEAGHDVYLIRWNEPSRLDQHLTLDDYVSRYVDNCVDAVRERSGQPAIDLLGYCMGGTMSAMYAALHPEKVNALGLMAAGLCFDDTGGVLEQWGAGEHYDPEDVTETFGNVPAEFLDVGFALMDPIDNYVSKYVRLAENVGNEDFVRNFARMEKWLSEGVDVAGEAYVEFLEKIYQNNDLYENRLEIGGKRVDLENVDMPVLQLMGQYDHLVPPAASKPFNDVVGSDDVTTIEYETGHIGLSVSSSSHENVWPQAAQWFSDRNREADAVDIDVQDPEVVERAAQAVAGEEAPEPGGEAAAEAEAATPDGETTAPDEETATPEAEAAEPDVSPDEEAPEETVSVGDDEAEVAEDAADDAATEGGEGTTDPETAGEQVDVETLDGIGPTYADRLRAAGIETTADLAEHAAADLAEIAQTSEARAGDWLDQL